MGHSDIGHDSGASETLLILMLVRKYPLMIIFLYTWPSSIKNQHKGTSLLVTKVFCTTLGII